MRLLVTLLVALALSACSSSSPAEKPATGAPPVAPPVASGAPAAVQPLRAYLQGAVKGRMRVFNEGGKPGMTQKQLGEAEVKEILGKIDLDQLPTGALVRCPSDKVIQFQDKDAKELGSIGWCGTAARFDGPNGVMGGIKAAMP
jgi:hypothetical protein